ncbi:MAG: cobaltochelatase subunit CobN [Parvibaculaceae bacterium]|nr:cobaltochelatase subunit CobN [Parvibaculaceae bacterium]
MHLLFRETRSLDEIDEAVDLEQSAADLVFLSFSDSDLGAAAAAWQKEGINLPSLRLATLASLRHPLSIDLYTEKVISGARCVVVRLLGGLDYWRYGAEELARLARARGIALALLPGDGREDPLLRDMSTVGADAYDRLDALISEGGPANLAIALRFAAHLAGLGPDEACAPLPIPSAGLHDFGLADHEGARTAALVFYRSYLLAGDMAPLDALARSLHAEGLNVRGLYVTSLKEAQSAALVAGMMGLWRPAVVLNATGFSARLGDGGSPLDAANAPVLQLVHASSSREAWSQSRRGLSPGDLAMQVVLPELDGRLLSSAISFKTGEETIPALQFTRQIHQPDREGIARVAAQAAGWTRLAATASETRKLALVLSDYPGAAGQAAHAVGLDAVTSTHEILKLLAGADYDTGLVPSSDDLARALCEAEPSPFLSLEDYRALFATLPEALQTQVRDAWGEADADSAIRDGFFTQRHLTRGNIILAIQPDRGAALDRKASYHDPDLPPRHAYLAFYLWLTARQHIHALIHLGTHGTLEWLPGKAAALSGLCWPALLTRGLPVIYPFIVNNPGEAAAAKRRLGAVMIGHLTPPLKSAGMHGAAAELEKLVDEFAAADGLDRRRTQLLRREILDEAASQGLLAESGVTQDMGEDDALARLDAYLCDVKDLQIREGLHVFGAALSPERRAMLLDNLVRACPAIEAGELAARLDGCAAMEAAALLDALDGRFIEPGPSGAPTRGRPDVLPTGRNLFSIDPRAVPTRSAMRLARKAADELLRRHMQDHGDWPRALMIDLWGSASMRTGGEDLALAFILMGVEPLWDHGSNRVTGIEITSLAKLDRPRIDVTLRISGLFRDTFEAQIALFDEAVRTLARRDEPLDWNPLAAARDLDGDAFRRATARIYGAAPGQFGAGVTERVERGAWTDKKDLGRDYLDASASAYGAGLDGVTDAPGFAARVKASEAFVHQQDHRELDLFESLDFAAAEGGFAAAADVLGSSPALYHADTSNPENPKARTVAEEVRRVVRGRAANPDWIEALKPHGYRGAAEVARTVEALFAFAATLPERFDTQFDLLFDATLGEEEVERFLASANRSARDAMAARFAEALRRDLWRPRRNAVGAMLERQS